MDVGLFLNPFESSLLCNWISSQELINRNDFCYFFIKFDLQSHFHNITINSFLSKKCQNNFLLVLEILVYWGFFMFCKYQMPFQIPSQKKELRKGKGFSSNRLQMELFDIPDTQTHLPRANTGRMSGTYEESYLRKKFT